MRHRPCNLLNLMAALLLLALLCAGCGGSSSSDSSGATISGVVADGYLSGARVFLDLNDNRAWDSGEPYATSSADGSYSISDITVEDYNSYPVVAEVTVTTTDQDTGKPVSHPYTLVSPAGHPEFISPLTTMIQVSYESNPDITLDEAEAAVKEMLSMEEATEVDLFSNYVEEKDDSDASASDYAKLHNIAQLSARIMGANISAIETAADDADVALDEAKDEILRMAVKEIMQSMDLIKEVATEDTEFDADLGVQVLDIQMNTTDIASKLESEEKAFQYQVPSLNWAAVFRDHQSGGGVDDFIAMALEHDLDLTGYTFTVEGPDATEYSFEEGDLYDDGNAPIAWFKSYDGLPEGEYTFYVTVPEGEKIEVAKDTHVHTVVPALSLTTAEVVNITGAYSRVYHDLLDGTYYYRMAIKENASGEIVYRTERRERNIQYFPSEYSTGDYAYRIEAWDRPLLKDATARSRTQWEDINSGGTTTDTYVEFYKGYRRSRFNSDGTTGRSDRLVLQIGITNPSDLQALIITDPSDNTLYTFDLSALPGEEVRDGDFYFLRGSGATNDGVAYADYFLMIFGNTSSGVYTWHATTASGNDFTRSITIFDKTLLPCIDPSTISITEDQYSDITLEWDAVDNIIGGEEKQVFYRVAIVKAEDWDNGYYAQRISKNTWKGSRADIEAVIGGSLDDDDVALSIWVLDSQYYSTVKNRSDFAPVPFIID